MVQTGIVRAFGTQIRKFLSKHLKNRLYSLLSGIGVTAVLQSSTAAAMMLSSFFASGMLELTPALAVMLGANIGTTLIVQLLAFDVSAAIPILIAIGVYTFKKSRRTFLRDLGRVFVGLGLMLLALHMLVGTFEPAQNSHIMRELMHNITEEPLLNLLIGMVIAWTAHSGIAAVLLAMSMSASGLITPSATIAFVLGANIGSALNPVFESVSGDNPAQRRLPVGNLINRLIGAIIILPFTGYLGDFFSYVPKRTAADFHTAFNLFTAVLFFPLLPQSAKLLEKILPEKRQTTDQSQPVYLDENALAIPSVALACAARETLRMGDIVQHMLTDGMTALLEGDRKIASEVCKMDNAVDSLHEAVKHYIVDITRDRLEGDEGKRALEIMTFSINLEHIGDIIDKNLMELAAKKIKNRLDFSEEGRKELEEMHGAVLDNLKVAFSVFMTGDKKLAEFLLSEKNRLRELETAASEKHILRLREGNPLSIETSSLHIDILRDLRRIHSHVCSAAYPPLETES
jgi:phosphate:Na+ symporter